MLFDLSIAFWDVVFFDTTPNAVPLQAYPATEREEILRKTGRKRKVLSGGRGGGGALFYNFQN
jgi:hypothetical protein